ncbi:MAG: TetR family transcriptional regulator [Mycobacterium sp.]|jgi:AcrR family transcriptional regulator|nr:TetR family transcriptional regulator [Mycobacterium sp.]
MPSVTRRPLGNRQERRERIEAGLLAAAERLMRDGTSFTELSVDRLATAAGISRATFYIYFEDKGDLLRRLARQVFGELADDASMWWNVASLRRPADMEATIGRILGDYRRHQPLIGALNEMSGYDAAVAATYRELMTGITAGLVKVITDGQDDGSIRPELPVAATASALTWMVERACHQNLPYQTIEHDRELASALTQIIWAALYLKPYRSS